MARKHAASVQSSGYNILVVDDQQEILSSNKAFLESFGHHVLTAASGNEALDLLRSDLIHLVIVDYFMPRMTGEELVREIRHLDEDVQVVLQTGYSGEKPPLTMLRELDIQGYHDKAEGPERLIIWVESSLKAASHLQKVRETERLKADFVANVSHELRTPLNVMLGYSEMLLDPDSGPLPAQVQDGLQRIYRQARSLTDLVDNFLNFAKVQAEVMDVSPQPVQLDDLREDLQTIMDFLLQDKAIDFSWQLGPDLPKVWADPYKLPLILRNLLSNAAKFTEEGSITVFSTLSASGDELAIHVQDTGVGIAPEHAETIFELFRQVDGSSTRRFGGMGIGLSLASQLTRFTGGTLRVKSALGEGAIFTLTLKVASHVLAVEQAHASSRVAFPVS